MPMHAKPLGLCLSLLTSIVGAVAHECPSHPLSHKDHKRLSGVCLKLAADSLLNPIAVDELHAAGPRKLARRRP
jgi:hypothetical protein